MSARRGGRGAGAEPDRLAIPGPWRSAIGRALGKPRPAEGWPERPTRKYTRRKPRAKK